MSEPTSILVGKKPRWEFLESYGFVRTNDQYFFSADILDGQFRLTLTVSAQGDTAFAVIDNATDEPYTLVCNENAVGAFVGSVRAACDAILRDIAAHCFEADRFQSAEALAIIRYVRQKYQTEAEFLWADSPHNAIFRDSATGKWYAVLLTVQKRKIGMDEDGEIEILDLTETPEQIAALVDGKCFLTGYHMNKRHWYTLRLDGSVPLDELYARIDCSVAVVRRKNHRRSRKNP